MAHFPGIRIMVPSNPQDAAAMMWTALKSEDPTLFLMPKHLFRIQMAEFADEGRPIVLADAGSPAARVLQQLAERVHSEAGTLGSALPILEG